MEVLDFHDLVRKIRDVSEIEPLKENNLLTTERAKIESEHRKVEAVEAMELEFERAHGGRP